MPELPAENMLAIRDGLNELPFLEGKRQVLIGRVTDWDELFPPLDQEGDGDGSGRRQMAIEQHLKELSLALSEHDLELVRGDDDADELFAVQRLRRESTLDMSWLGEATGWAARIMAIALEMVLPIVVGMWLDARFGTNFLAAAGILLGLPLGLWHLLKLTRRTDGAGRGDTSSGH